VFDPLYIVLASAMAHRADSPSLARIPQIREPEQSGLPVSVARRNLMCDIPSAACKAYVNTTPNCAGLTVFRKIDPKIAMAW
jgi:hypothetical protein